MKTKNHAVMRFRRLTHFFLNHDAKKWIVITEKNGETFNGNSRKCIENHLNATFYAHSLLQVFLWCGRKFQSYFDELIFWAANYSTHEMWLFWTIFSAFFLCFSLNSFWNFTATFFLAFLKHFHWIYVFFFVRSGITCCGWLLTVFVAAITASAADGFPAIGLAANRAWWCDCTCCCLFKWCCNCWCCKCAAATAAGIWGWWWLIVAVSEAIE